MKLSTGRHLLTVAMDLNDGLAWGFFLRLRCLGLSKTELSANGFSRPEFV